MSDHLKTETTEALVRELKSRCRALAVVMVGEPDAEAEVGDAEHGGIKVSVLAEPKTGAPLAFAVDHLRENLRKRYGV